MVAFVPTIWKTPFVRAVSTTTGICVGSGVAGDCVGDDITGTAVGAMSLFPLLQAVIIINITISADNTYFMCIHPIYLEYLPILQSINMELIVSYQKTFIIGLKCVGVINMELNYVLLGLRLKKVRLLKNCHKTSCRKDVIYRRNTCHKLKTVKQSCHCRV
jgi:hypothetical protein